MNRLNFTATFLLAGITFLFLSCGGDSNGGGDGGGDPDPIPAPSATSLVFPDNNSECTEGDVISPTQSQVVFQWNASQNTDSYQINLRNLNSGTTSVTSSTGTSSPVLLLRGVPYEWFVVSRANGTSETASSPTWRFFNAGPGISNYAPFPAQAVAPTRGATLSTTPTVVLEWSGADVDNDISRYTISFGTENPPPLLETGITGSTLETNVQSGNTYYWQVATIDSAENVTNSEVFVFRVE
ncbi:hypothetical protein [Robiginitalea aurantiaca]|uniref:Fibronectin type-III domain-containing protein n=1 Tax=Robiginitalea aurantiaca TaxID=3056915 RepID=A0ABT7WFA6_9FLAO|nr:hypothetical protein [Robiginitalea aurantiaca]MDM9631602.1 hypothetical protein [Robiginitalea aurantiaca]